MPARGACWCVAMRVDRLECWGGLRGRAGWDDGPEELEEASLTSLESLRASWLMPGPETGFADCRKAGGGQGAGALLRCRTEDLSMMIRIKSAGGTSYAVAWGRITCPSRNAKNGESMFYLDWGTRHPRVFIPPGTGRFHPDTGRFQHSPAGAAIRQGCAPSLRSPPSKTNKKQSQSVSQRLCPHSVCAHQRLATSHIRLRAGRGATV